jgi:thiol-disulfide isomerase/thioredoxin
VRPEWRARALDFESYLAKADMNVPTMRENFRDTRIPDGDRAYFDDLSGRLSPGQVTVLALSESWCGDCVENLPVIAKVASLYPFMDLLIFPRDINLDIMDEYLTDGKRTIPVFVFYDESGEEIGRFVERPPPGRRAEEGDLQSQDRPQEALQRGLKGRHYRHDQGDFGETVWILRRLNFWTFGESRRCWLRKRIRF